MSREIDDRIVAMHFQNEEFERKAKQTINTLEKLQQKMDLEGAADSFTSVTKATSKQLGLKETTKEAKEFSSAIKSAGEMGKKAITSLTSPIRNTMGLLSDLRRYAGIALGFDIGNKLVSTAENLMQAFTVQPVSAGWSEYELKMDSIKTIMTGTKNEFVKAAEAAGKAYDEATHLASVKDALEDLNKYADDTIYSFKDMTSNIGKFVNNGVSLDKAVLAMRGISNAAALAGQGTQQASMAMYNLSQAISVGKLTTMDWKSIENANMATLEMKQAILETAAAAGQLEKIDGKLYITEKDFYQGKKVSAQQRKADLEKRLVTAENFRNMLHYGFANSEVITNVLEIFSGAEELTHARLRAMGFTDDEEIDRLIKLGKEAFKAATEVRTFSKMMDALKEAAQSGWAVSFELIFGDMNEATDLWSTLNEKLSGILQKSADNRNNMLRRWRGMTYDKDLHEWVRDPNKQDGRQILIESLDRLFTSIMQVVSVISRAKEEVLGSFTSATLMNITKWIEKISKAFSEWLNADHQKNLKKITSIFKGFFTVIKIVWNTAKKAISFLSTALKPVLSFLFDTFAAIGQWLSQFKNLTIGEAIGKIVDWFKKLTREKVADWFVKLGDSVKKVFGDVWTAVSGWLKDNGLGGVVTFFEGIYHDFEAAWNWFSTLSIWDTIGAFLGDAWTWIKEKAGVVGKALVDAWDFMTSKETIDSITYFITSAKETVEKTLTAAWNAISNWDGWKTIGGFLADVWGWIKKQAGVVGTTVAEAWNKLTSEETINNIKSFIATAWTSFVTIIRNGWNAISNWDGWKTIGGFLANVWGWIKEQAGVVGSTVSEVWNNLISEETINNIKSFIATAWTSFVTVIRNGWNTISNWSGWETIGGFLANVWGWIKEQAGVVGSTVSEVWNNLISEETINNIKSFIATAWVSFVAIIRNGWNAISNWTGWETIGGFLANAWEWIKEQAGAAYSALSSAISFATSEETIQNISDFVTGAFHVFCEVVDKAWNAIYNWPGWETIGGFLMNVWDWILKQIGYTGDAEKAEKDADALNGQAATQAGAAVSEALDKNSNAILVITGAATAVIGATQGLVESAENSDIWQVVGDVLSTIWSGLTTLFETVAGVVIGEDTLRDIQTILGNTKDIIIEILKFITDYGAKLVGAKQWDDNDWITSIIAFIGIIGTVFLKIKKLNALKGLAGLKNVSITSDSLGTTLLKLAGSLYLVALAFATIASIPQDVMEQGIVRFSFIVAALTLFAIIADSLKSAPSIGNEPTTSGERAIKTIAGYAAIATVLSLLITTLPDIIRSLKDANLQPGQVQELATSFAISILSLVIAFRLIASNKFDPASMATGMMSIATGLFFLMGIVAAVAIAFGDNALWENQQAFIDMMDSAIVFFEKIGELLGTFIGSLLGTLTGSAIDNAVGDMDSVAVALTKASDTFKDVDTAGLNKIASVISMFASAAMMLPTNVEFLGVIKLFSVNKTSIQDFAAMLPSVAINVKSAADNAKGLDYDSIQRVANVMKVFALLQSSLIGDLAVPGQFEQLRSAIQNGGRDYATLAGLSGSFETIADNVVAASEKLKGFNTGDLSFIPLETVVSFMERMGKIALDAAKLQSLGNLNVLFDGMSWFESLGKTLDFFNTTEGLGSLTKTAQDASNVAAIINVIIKPLNKAIADASTEVDSTPLLLAMTEGLTNDNAAHVVRVALRNLAMKMNDADQYDAELGATPLVSVLHDALNNAIFMAAQTIDASPFLEAIWMSLQSDDTINKFKVAIQNAYNNIGITVPEIASPTGLQTQAEEDASAYMQTFQSMLGQGDGTGYTPTFTLGVDEEGMKKTAAAVQTSMEQMTAQISESAANASAVVPVTTVTDETGDLSWISDMDTIQVSGTVGINSSDIQSVTTAVNQNMMAIGNVAMRTAETRDAVNSLANTVARLEDDILRMRVMLYPDIIAGYVDKYQYNQLMRP